MPEFFGLRDYISPTDIHKQEKMTFFKKFGQKAFYVLIFRGTLLQFCENDIIPVMNSHNSHLKLFC